MSGAALRHRGLESRGTLFSLGFWCSLFVAAGLYAAVTLSPKLRSVRELDQVRYEQQRRLLHLERLTEQLSLVVEALEHDSQFASEITRLEFDAARPGEELIQVDSELTLSPVSVSNTQAPAPHAVADTWQVTLDRLSADDHLRLRLLGSAALLVILAFTFLQDTPHSPSARSNSGPLRRLRSRYQTGSR